MLANFVANDAADYSTADRPHGTATGQYRSAYCASPRANRGVLVSR
jgi:hypothetical protein